MDAISECEVPRNHNIHDLLVVIWKLFLLQCLLMGLAMHSTLSPHFADIQIWSHVHKNDQSNGPF